MSERQTNSLLSWANASSKKYIATKLATLTSDRLDRKRGKDKKKLRKGRGWKRDLRSLYHEDNRKHFLGKNMSKIASSYCHSNTYTFVCLFQRLRIFCSLLICQDEMV